jgi:hypothetical protein
MGSMFKAKTPEYEAPAQAVDNPVVEPEAPVMGASAQESTEQKAKKGKKGLKIELDKSAKGSAVGVGANVV